MRSASTLGSLTNTVMIGPRPPPSSTLTAPGKTSASVAPASRSETCTQPLADARQHPSAPNQRKDEDYENELPSAHREHPCYFIMPRGPPGSSYGRLGAPEPTPCCPLYPCRGRSGSNAPPRRPDCSWPSPWSPCG